MVQRVGFEPTKHVNAADLQSDAIVHSAIPKKSKDEQFKRKKIQKTVLDWT